MSTISFIWIIRQIGYTLLMTSQPVASPPVH
ncbi:MAG: hypothetical protein JWM19_2629, partial [Actinomycetia bacterium]|nr:hypothetical protein [Actinomycetes bacterium]